MSFTPKKTVARLIWFADQPATRAHHRDDAEAWPDLRNAERAKQAFGLAMRGLGDLHPPWKPLQSKDRGAVFNRPSDHFWRRYHELSKTKKPTPRDCVRRMVPLRYDGAEPSRTLVAGKANVGWEAFIYPHATVLIATIYLQGADSLENAVNELIRVRHEYATISWPEVAASRPQTLESAATEIVRRAEMNRLKADYINTRLEGPFVVSAVLDATGKPLDPFPDDVSTLQVLRGLATLSRDWMEKNPGPLEPAVVERRFLDGFIYAVPSGRTVWYPARALASGPRERGIGCYSRNLTMLAMQMTALVRYLREMSSHDAGQLSPTEIRQVREVIGVLTRSYSKPALTSDTGPYYSKSAPHLLRDLGAAVVVRRAATRVAHKIPEWASE